MEITETISDTSSSDTEKSLINNKPDKVIQNNPTEKITAEDEPAKEEEEEIKNEPEVIAFEEPQNITLDQAYSLFNDGITFIDARDEADYLNGRIENSINIPYYDFDNHKQKLDALSKDKPLILYCAGTDCDLSILLANQLMKLNYKKIYIFFGGWLEWLNAGYPIENGSEQ